MDTTGPMVTAPHVFETEAAALESLHRGDRDGAVDVLMRDYGTVIYRFCLQMLSDPDLAHDVLQNTFVHAYEALPRFRGRSTLRTWLFGIARHRCLDAAKSTRRRRRRFPASAEVAVEPADARPLADERLVRRAVLDALRRCLHELAPRIRDTLLLRFQAGLTYGDMAQVSGERPATLQVRVARALPVLRRCVEAAGVAP